ncbi:hypothetical protein VTO42DRAFT_7563 [Malbranchea cinnamomea]
MEFGRAPRSTSRPRPSSRPTTPLRPSSRSSIRDAHTRRGSASEGCGALTAINSLEPQFAELADSMADLEANFMHLQLMHESLSRFTESFASFLYGLNMNAFCVDFPEAPIPESFHRARQAGSKDPTSEPEAEPPVSEGETTVLTTDTTFIENPPMSSKVSSRYSTPAESRLAKSPARGTTVRGRYSTRGSTAARRGTSGIARAKPRGSR